MHTTPETAHSPVVSSRGAGQSIDRSPLTGKPRQDFQTSQLALVKGSAQLVLRVLFDFARGKADCYPSNSTIAKTIGQTPRNVQYLLDRLAAAGILVNVVDRSVMVHNTAVQRRLVLANHPSAPGVLAELRRSPYTVIKAVPVGAGVKNPVGAGVKPASPKTVNTVEAQSIESSPEEKKILAGNGGTVGPPPPGARKSPPRAPAAPPPSCGRRRRAPLVDWSKAPDDDPVIRAEKERQRAAEERVAQQAQPSNSEILSMVLGTGTPQDSPGAVPQVSGAAPASPAAAVSGDGVEAKESSPATGPAITYRHESEIIGIIDAIKPGSTKNEVAMAAVKLGLLLGDDHSHHNWLSVLDHYRRGHIPKKCFHGIAGGDVKNPAAVVMSRIRPYLTPSVPRRQTA